MSEIDKCNAAAIGIDLVGERQQWMDELEAYLSAFVAPDGEQRCCQCRSRLTGVFGTFRWGAVNGEGECINCRWPARGIHRMKLEHDGYPVFHSPLEVVLQYHPDVCFADTESEAEDE